MADICLHSHAFARPDLPVPQPRSGGTVTVRIAQPSDLSFVDGLQKKQTRAVGWMPTKQLETYITNGDVLIAEQNTVSAAPGVIPVQTGIQSAQQEPSVVPWTPACAGVTGSEGSAQSSQPTAQGSAAPQPVGYCISRDRYFKRDDVGIVYQLNVAPGSRRGLIGATLIREVFHRAAWGCRLFCCWCAQDLEANRFWEAMGFVPLAFRTGSAGRGKNKQPRIHIFWQRRIREGDCETPYWFPSQTSAGAVREDRLVLPIPPGTHWSDAKPAVLPGMENVGRNQLESAEEDAPKRAPRRRNASKPAAPTARRSRLWFGPAQPTAEEKNEAAKAKRENGPRKPKQKNDPKLIAAARELRDRYMEQINAGGPGSGFDLPPSASGKYEVSRSLEAAPTVMAMGARTKQVPRLDAA